MTDATNQAWRDEAARMKAERDEMRSRAKSFRRQATVECRKRDPLKWISLRESAMLLDQAARQRDDAFKAAMARVAQVSA